MKKQRGFTLLELMITVGIVAILAGMAMAGYGYAMKKTRRAAAEGCLSEQAQAMERAYTQTMQYSGAAVPSCSTDVDRYYTVRPVSGEPTLTTFAIEAVPKDSQAGDSCGTLRINHLGRKTPSTQGCW